MWKRICLIFMCVWFLSCTSEPIYNAIDIGISPKQNAGDAEISEVIWLAGRRLGWEIVKIKLGEMFGTYKIRDHTAMVNIYYDRHKFSIVYYDSINLNYASDEIHRNYNVWISKLEKQIQNEGVGA